MPRRNRVTEVSAGYGLWTTPVPITDIGTIGAAQTIFNVKIYGATGGGAVDDTTAVQDAITAACEVNNSCVYFPPGKYLITPSPFGLTLTTGFAGKITFKGDGWQVSQLIYQNNGTCLACLLANEYATNNPPGNAVEIEDLAFIADNSTGTPAYTAIAIDYSSEGAEISPLFSWKSTDVGSAIRRVFIGVLTNSGGYVHPGCGWAFGITTYYAWNLFLDELYLHGNSDTYTAGTAVGDGDGGAGSGAGLSIYSGSDNVFGRIYASFWSQAVQMKPGTSLVPYGNCQRNLFDQLIIFECVEGIHTYSATGTGFSSGPFNDLVITNTQIHNETVDLAAHRCIEIDNAAQVTISGCLLYQCGGNPVITLNACANCRVVDCLCSGPASEATPSAPLPGSGVYFTSDSTQNTITGCEFLTVGAAAAVDSGSTVNSFVNNTGQRVVIDGNSSTSANQIEVWRGFATTLYLTNNETEVPSDGSPCTVEWDTSLLDDGDNGGFWGYTRTSGPGSGSDKNICLPGTGTSITPLQSTARRVRLTANVAWLSKSDAAPSTGNCWVSIMAQFSGGTAAVAESLIPAASFVPDEIEDNDWYVGYQSIVTPILDLNALANPEYLGLGTLEYFYLQIEQDTGGTLYLLNQQMTESLPTNFGMEIVQ